ncbi:hypothetical protein V493_01195 [Pseudogymnoascus sp. VKM F-4281 (FW-2241)]|nr:hypothetical protein V493_01195 [Pseudogymnoascus sp. VKM F-4281 (FW-2241)]
MPCYAVLLIRRILRIIPRHAVHLDALHAEEVLAHEADLPVDVRRVLLQREAGGVVHEALWMAGTRQLQTLENEEEERVTVLAVQSVNADGNRSPHIIGLTAAQTEHIIELGLVSHVLNRHLDVSQVILAFEDDGGAIREKIDIYRPYPGMGLKCLREVPNAGAAGHSCNGD